MSLVDDQGREFSVDLTNCDREPIHVPGHVQPFGSLLALDPESLRVLQASENVRERFGIPVDDLLGKLLSDLLSPEQVAMVAALADTERLEAHPLLVFSEPVKGRGPFHAVLHAYEGVLILELEDVDPKEAKPDYDVLINRRLARLEATNTLADLCQVLAQEVREITGFDRVMVYRFLEDASGTVVGESLAEGMEPFFGLHYPASDIPKQARQLFLQIPTRLIFDSSYTPSPVVPAVNPLTGRALDMSYAVLRGVSPIHCQYLRNMGVVGSMSQSIVVDGKLWGLVSSHANSAQPVPYGTRTTCEFLAKSAALMVKSKIAEEASSYVASAREQQERLTRSLAQHPAIIDGLTGSGEPIEKYVNAAGCAIVADGDIYLSGRTPTRAAIMRIVTWLRAEIREDLFVTDNLPRQYVDGEAVKDDASGVLAIRITRVPGEFVLWFRPEKLQTVNWAGNPEKPMVATDEGMKLSPRNSFALWQQEVRCTSIPWTESEIEAARRLRLAVQEVVVRRAEDVSRANVRLEKSNVELDDFAYIASHDLKEPLRGMHNYATFVLEDYGDRIDEAGRQRLETLIRLAERMETLTDSLLHYSRLGRQELDLQNIDLNAALQDALDATSSRLVENAVDVRIPWPLPTLRCDPIQITEVLQNLISNGAKYNDKPNRWIEVGVTRAQETRPNEQPYVLYVRDNGIGIPQKHQETVFRIFKRLHGRNDYGGGSGAGLTIARKIVERHEGRLWLESTPGEGTTFYFTVGNLEATI